MLEKAPSDPFLCLCPGGNGCVAWLNWLQPQARGAYIRYLLCAPRAPWEGASVLIR